MENIVRLTPAKRASLRTRNRIREHGPSFVVIGGPRVPIFSPRTGEWLLLRAANPEDDWSGWLPLSEIKAEAG